MRLEERRQKSDIAAGSVFDVVVVGGGISGAAVFERLAGLGYRVVLLEKGDFAGGTSQASAMMVWGNLTDLRTLNLRRTRRSCVSRESLIGANRESVSPQTFRFLPVKNGRSAFSSFAAFYSYWLLGAGRRTFPRYRKEFPEAGFLKKESFKYSFDYQEAVVKPSDARFVLDLILKHRNELQIALNYCELAGGGFDPSEKLWHLETRDAILGVENIVKTKFVVNAAGVWTDDVNKRFSIASPFKHIFGKGVFIGIKRPAGHHSTLMIETRDEDGCMALIPWGPISLWGPTETRSGDVASGFRETSEDVRFLLGQLNRHSDRPIGTSEIISLRCGVRPLVVGNSFPDAAATAAVPREYKVQKDRRLPWISIYGGKITSCEAATEAVLKIIREAALRSERSVPVAAAESPEPEFESFPGLAEEVIAARFCADEEMCWTLEDYLRRRTNISQWIPRGGLGLHNENVPVLEKIAEIFSQGTDQRVCGEISDYKRKVEDQFDRVLRNI